MTGGIPEIRADGPVLIFGGPYGNLEATQAVFAEARRRGIRPDHMICTGDLAAYCAEPQATIDLIRHSGCAVVLGNCEESLAAGSGDCGCGFKDDTACAVLSDAWYRYCDANTAADVRPWLGSLPPRIDLVIDGRRLAVVHGAPSRINRFVFESDLAAMGEELAALDGDGIVGGHSGIPFTRNVGGRLWHNAGVVGLPANDGTPRVWFSVLTPLPHGELRIEHAALGYDHRAAAAKMRASGLPEGYAAALETGLWPSLDVLPPTERAAMGTPIEPRAIVWDHATRPPPAQDDGPPAVTTSA